MPRGTRPVFFFLGDGTLMSGVHVARITENGSASAAFAEACLFYITHRRCAPSPVDEVPRWHPR